MGVQFVDIKDSNVKFVNEKNDPIKRTEEDLANITFESMMDKMQIASLEEISAALTFDVMQLKMGGIQ